MELHRDASITVLESNRWPLNRNRLVRCRGIPTPGINLSQPPVAHRWFCYKPRFVSKYVQCLWRPLWQCVGIVSCPAVEAVPSISSLMGLLIPPRPPHPLSNFPGTARLKLNVSQTVYGRVKDNVHRGGRLFSLSLMPDPGPPMTGQDSILHHGTCMVL